MATAATSCGEGGENDSGVLDGGWPDTFLKYEALAASLPPPPIPVFGGVLLEHGNFWYPRYLVAPTLAMRDTFQARPTDVILATFPKSGATWLKALVFAVVHRHRHPPGDACHPLLASSPHDLAPFLHSLYESRSDPPGARLEAMPPPRILGVHTPLSGLPASVASSGCRVVYLCREPKDLFVSIMLFADKIKPEGFTVPLIEEAFELFCHGVAVFGPPWDHMAEYWKESVARPDAVMFLRYEQLKKDAVGSVKKLAGFLGCPFTGDEVAGGVPEAVVALCSIDRMRRVEANQEGTHGVGWSTFKNSAFFRNGEVGDWREHMTAAMARRLDAVVEEKLRGSGLSLIGD